MLWVHVGDQVLDPVGTEPSRDRAGRFAGVALTLM